MKQYIVGILWFLCIWALLWFFLSTTFNTLARNGHWKSTKTTAGVWIMGSSEYINGTQALAHNALHLDAWDGFQEVTSVKTFIPGEITFSLKLAKNSYVYIEYGRNNNSFSAFRLSTNPHFPSQFITATTDGKFTSAAQFTCKLTPDRWYNVALKMSPSHSSADLYVDNALIVHETATQSFAGSIGFRGSLNPVTIDSVKVFNQNGHLIFSDSFSFTRKKYFLFSVVLTFALLCIVRLITNLRPKNTSLTETSATTVKLGIIFVLLIALAVSLYISNKYIRVDGIMSFYWNKISSDWKKEVINEKQTELGKIKLQKAYRILFIGGSQTWGSGATKPSDTFVAQTEKILNQQVASQLENNNSSESFNSEDIQCINLGMNGFNSTDLLKLYTTQWLAHFKPNMLVIDMSANDDDPAIFKANLTKFVQVNSSDVKTIFILEANSMEQNGKIKQRHDVMRRVAQEYNIPLIDLYSYLIDNNEKGIIWWDYVHPTSFGYRLAAEYISQQIEPYIQPQ